MTEPEHSEISPSNFDRVALCNGSVLLNRPIPEQPERAVSWSGTCAHKLLEVCASQSELIADNYLGCELEAKGKPFTVEAGHVRSVNVTLDLFNSLRDPDDWIFVEESFPLERIGKGIKGKGDLGVIKIRDRHLHIIDHKDGMKLVEVTTRQLKGYGFGGWLRFGKEHNIEWVTCWISQPNAVHPDGPVRSVTYHVLELIDWAEEMRAVVARTEDPNAPRVPGDHCTFCKAADTLRCPEYLAKNEATAAAVFDVVTAVPPAEGVLVKGERANATFATPDPDVMGKVLTDLPLLEKQIEAFKALVKTEARKGNIPTGYVWEAGRGERSWLHDEAIVAVNIEHATGKDLFVRTFPSPPQVEKLLGAAEYRRIVAQHVKLGNQAPRLVQASKSKNPLTLAEVNALGKSDAFEAISHPE